MSKDFRAGEKKQMKSGMQRKKISGRKYVLGEILKRQE